MKKNIELLFSLLLISLFLPFCSNESGGEFPDEEQPVIEGDGGYLFAHMTDKNYGKLFYSISRDGLRWTTLNDGKIILADYNGHPDICKGGDGNYYMIGVQSSDSHYLTLFSSSDLVAWKRNNIERAVFDVSHLGQQNEGYYVGAPKMFYDEESKQFIITWHASYPGLKDQVWWEGMRTCFVLTSDFKTFTKAQRLFDFTGTDADMATIDTIIKKEGGKYYAIIKDERWPDKCRTGKTIRIAISEYLTGPYENPGSSITPAWREAPILVKSPDNEDWYLFTEDYQNAQYNLFKSKLLTGAMWSQIDFTPPVARHGCIIRIDEKKYQTIQKAYNK